MKRLLHRTLHRFGLDVVRTRTVNDALSQHLANVLSEKHIDCVIDVGANAGQYGARLRATGYRGRIVSFEPVAAAFARLSALAKGDPDWECHQLALGARSGEATINVFAQDEFASFLPASAFGKETWGALSHARPENVKVVRLDDIFDELVGARARSCLLKMDTQGFDKFVFEGAQGCLDRVAALQSELSLIAVYEGMPSMYDVLRDYHDAGFFISGMYPVNRDESLAVIEFDCVLVTRRPAPAGPVGTHVSKPS